MKLHSSPLLHYTKICLLLLVVSTSSSSCFKAFYATGTKEEPTLADVKSIDLDHKKVILHLDDTILMMKDMRLMDTVLTGNPGQLHEPYTKYTNPEKNRPNKYKRKSIGTLDNQVHIYARLALAGLDPKEHLTVTVPLGTVYRIDQYKHDKEATTRNYVFSALGIVAFVGLVVFAVKSISIPMSF